MAGRCGRTRIAIVAIQFVGGKDAVAVLTGFVCAGVSIIAGNGFASDAFAVDAAITDGAGVSVHARPDEELVRTPAINQAGIGGARIVIVAFQGTFSSADSGVADVSCGAGVVVIAAIAVRGMDTSGVRITRIVGAWIPVIACQAIFSRLAR